MKNNFPNLVIMVRFLLIVISIFILAAVSNAQTAANTVSKKTASNQTVSAIKSSPAYAEILLLKTELESQLEDFLGDYTEDFPKVKQLRFQLALLRKETDKLFSVNATESSKLTLALGKLIIRKIELETNLWNLKTQYKDDYPDVRKAKQKVAVFERAIREILP